MIDFNMGLGVLIIVLFMLVASAIRILREYERGVIFLSGRFGRVKGPGLIIVIPGIQQMVRVDLRVITMDVPEQDVISRDNVSVKVNAVLYFRVMDPEKAIIQVEDYLGACKLNCVTAHASIPCTGGYHEQNNERARPG